MERKMQLGADGDLRLASVRRTNPLAPSAASSAGTKPTAPAIYEYEYAEMSDAAAPKAVSDEPLYDDVS
ncbi:MAG: hypothetical protein P8J87_08765 [Verrucomicrobiales bacterium]|nr:hypothetical protein [Verrucomicrobiales bacterium]